MYKLGSDAEAHFHGLTGPFEFTDLPECVPEYTNVGWTLGNDCPYRCTHCYSMSARHKGANLELWMVDRVADQLSRLGIETVNLGGNEPLFTHGLDTAKSLLPYIIRSLTERRIAVGLTTAGISLVHLNRSHQDELRLLNDIDISFDSPFEEEHDRNRCAALYGMAERSLTICCLHGIARTIIMTAMNWNFDRAHLKAMVDLARRYDANLRINPLKPVEAAHMGIMPDAQMFYAGFAYLMAECEQIDLGEPLLATVCSHSGKGCPCGRSSFRIHSITPEGKIPVAPCVYLHEYKVGDLLTEDISHIVNSAQFRSFRRRVANPTVVAGCDGCAHLDTCRGGCAARSYLHNLHEFGMRSLFSRDPYCLRNHSDSWRLGEFPQKPTLPTDRTLVHRNYLCTWIGKPR